jgi:hypothetical protein
MRLLRIIPMKSRFWQPFWFKAAPPAAPEPNRFATQALILVESMIHEPIAWLQQTPSAAVPSRHSDLTTLKSNPFERKQPLRGLECPEC